MLQVGVAYDDKALRKMPAEVEPRVAEALLSNTEDILWMAKALCPVDTGALRASLHIEQMGEFEYAVRDGVSYGIFVEKGHRLPSEGFVPAQPFLAPAVERMRSRAEKRIADAVKTGAERVAMEEEAMIARMQAKLQEIKRSMGGGFGTIGEARARVAASRGK